MYRAKPRGLPGRRAVYTYGRGVRHYSAPWLLSVVALLLFAVSGGFALAINRAQPHSDHPNKQPVAAALPAAQISENSGVQIGQDSSEPVQLLLDSWAAMHKDHQWSVVVQGLGSDSRWAAVNPATSYNSASIFKLLLTERLFGLYNPASLNTVQLSVDGRGPDNLQHCVQLMLQVSDNSCGQAVGNLLGWSKASAAVRKIGLSNTNLNNPSGPTTTAADVALYLYKLQNGQLFDSVTSGYILGLMQHQTLRKGIPAGCPKCSVADKTGDLGSVRHDAGIINDTSGHQYVLSIFTDGASYAQIAQLSAQVESLMSAN